MRIWSLHPKLLDAKGIVALWRETLLAKHVLEGKTKGYKNHPQLNRFKNCKDPLGAINHYLSIIFFEAEERGYHFTKEKVDWSFKKIKLAVTKGQVDYELTHLKKKLKLRDPNKLKEILKNSEVAIHPLFRLKSGNIEDWEVLS